MRPQIASILFFVCITLLFTNCQNQSKTKTEEDQPGVFLYGVASGDPLSDAVIIWTKVESPPGKDVPGQWKVFENEDRSEIVAEGSFSAKPSDNWTVKVDVSGLEPNARYWYQFECMGQQSPVGQTKTAPVKMVDSLSFAVVSCSNYEAGYFNAFARIAEIQVDAVLHLGDYIYEYGIGRYGDTTLDRKNIPEHEIITLEDYRQRYAVYRSDIDFQKVHQLIPFITIWDDHEITNNAYVSGAENHQAEEGDYEARKAAARKAYYEWLPVREQPDGQLYRSFEYGSLAKLIMLDERIEGRTEQAVNEKDPTYNSPDRTMLGAKQLAWFENEIENSSAVWKIVGNQVIYSPVDMSSIFPDNPHNMDSWDGYPYERTHINEFITDQEINGLIVLSGDTHSSWAFEIPSNHDASNTVSSLGIELGTPSISSANWDESRSVEEVLSFESSLLDPESNPHMKYINLRDHGYLLLTVKEDEASARWYYVETLKKRDNRERLGKELFFTARKFLDL